MLQISMDKMMRL